ncbi:MAG: response regulator [Bacteroidales bacterium]|nr:response regulator [Bacteroidales bacterium]
MKVLLLEDNPSDADLTKRRLIGSVPDCTIEHASTLEQARKFLNASLSFDIALLDVNLPDGNGLKFLTEIRQRELDFPVIILTGSGDEDAAVTALKAGADDYIVKRSGYILQLPDIINLAITNFKENDIYKSDVINVLYLEHHAVDIDFTIRHLAQYAPYIHVDAVSTAEEALSKLKIETADSFKHNVILMDYRLPGMNALELIKAIRQNLKLCIPIILITGQGNEELAVQALKLGANDYLTKSEKYLYRLPFVIVNSYQHCELKKRQDALVESESKYRLLADNSGDVIFVLDMDLNYTFISPAVRILRGFEPEEAIKQKISEVLTPASYQKAVKVISEILSENLSSLENSVLQKTIELEMIRKDKTTIWTEVKASLITDKNNNPVGIIGVTRDISERKSIMEKLRKLSQAVEQSPALIVITDTKGNIEYVNPKFTEITGYSLQEVLGKNSRILKSGFTTNSEYENLWNTITSGSEWKGEFHNKRKDGSLYWEEASITSIKTTDGQITHFLAVKSDITEKKKIIDELIIAKEKAEESDRLKTAFLQNMSHEIRTPMNGILGFIGLLKNPTLDGEDRIKFIEIVEISGQRLLTTINDIIEIAKIESCTVEVTLKDENIEDILQNHYNFFNPEIEKKGLSLKITCQHDEKNNRVFTDRYKLDSVFINLINNAIKFTERGNIEIGCYRDGNYHVFYVRDTGIGIPANKQEAIFERFVQADLTITRGYEGSGLGLSISKSYIELLGGKIWLDSVQNTGTTFYFSIPYKAINQDLTVVPEQINKIPVRFDSAIKILIAEDEESSFLFLESILSEYGIVPIHARNGAEAIIALKNNSDIAVILMDLKMPVLDGFKATRKIRQFDQTTPIIAQTAYAFSSDKENAIEAGCNDYISKPINESKLISLIQRYTKNAK